MSYTVPWPAIAPFDMRHGTAPALRMKRRLHNACLRLRPGKYFPIHSFFFRHFIIHYLRKKCNTVFCFDFLVTLFYSLFRTQFKFLGLCRVQPIHRIPCIPLFYILRCQFYLQHFGLTYFTYFSFSQSFSHFSSHFSGHFPFTGIYCKKQKCCAAI